jgi:diguanylate cyclase (GGDEF)-like protein
LGTLLIIDDSSSSRREIIKILQETGEFSRFLEAGDGATGLQVFSEAGSEIDLVVCDIIMPRMDGYEFLKSVKAIPSLFHIPVVMVSADSKLKDIVKAFELGAHDYIHKPFIPPILTARLKNTLRIKQLHDQLKIQKDLMEKLATIDPLTDISNVRYFRQRLEDELGRAARYRYPLALVMIDIDHFKNINDTYGHPQGDSVLKEMVELLKQNSRKVDLQARYGGEEFVLALPHTTCEGATLAAERLRAQVEKHRFAGFPEPVKVTISVGIAQFNGRRDLKAQDLINEADQALYKAKNKGRNCVELAPLCHD